MKAALIGLGSVGRGVTEMIAKKNPGITITGIADSKSGYICNEGIDIMEVLETKRTNGICGDRAIAAMDVIKKADFDVLIEVTPTNALTGEPALGYIRAALARKKHIVTSNKGPIALAYRELAALAKKKGVALRYEATVGGAIPIMHMLEDGLGGNEIIAIYGVLNGTCNYILTRMADEGLTYEQALMEAREMGYAEADPTYDVKGIDAAIKLVILANTIWGDGTKLADIDLTGIDLLTPDALRLAEEGDLYHPVDRRGNTEEKDPSGLAASHREESPARGRRDLKCTYPRDRYGKRDHADRQGCGIDRDGERHYWRYPVYPRPLWQACLNTGGNTCA